jgi:hypothetical protein
MNLRRLGFSRVYSYGTSDFVRLPGRAGPATFVFGTPYSDMLKHLCKPNNEDAAWVTATGLRDMLQRDASVKTSPHQWQSLASGAGPTPDALGPLPATSAQWLPKVPSASSTSLSPSSPTATVIDGDGNRRVQGKAAEGERVTVAEHDFVLCFDSRVFALVCDDLRFRGLHSVTNDDGIAKLVGEGLTGFTSLALAPTLGVTRSSSSPNPGSGLSASAASPNNASGTERRAQSVHVILLHTPDNLADAAVAGRLTGHIAQMLCTAAASAEPWVVEKEGEGEVNSTLSSAAPGDMISASAALSHGDSEEVDGNGDSTRVSRRARMEAEARGGQDEKDQEVDVKSATTEVSFAWDAPMPASTVRRVLRDVELEMGLVIGSMLHQEWRF